eukprot:3649260-Pleurochrysis_carterae.AAC.1
MARKKHSWTEAMGKGLRAMSVCLLGKHPKTVLVKWNRGCQESLTFCEASDSSVAKVPRSAPRCYQLDTAARAGRTRCVRERGRVTRPSGRASALRECGAWVSVLVSNRNGIK